MQQLADIKNRIANIGEIESVVMAMRAIAAAHAQEARGHLAAIAEHAETIGEAMGRALALLGAAGPGHGAVPADHEHLDIVVGAAQGFSGLYNETIVSAALAGANNSTKPRFMLVGQRCVAEFKARGHEAVWSANMVAHAGEVPALASRIADELYQQVASGRASSVGIVNMISEKEGDRPAFRRLIPFDFARFKPVQEAFPPVVTIDPAELVAQLVEEYVFSEICEALMVAFACENNARMNAMTRARTNVRRIGRDLRLRLNQVRQAETTNEIIEVSVDA